MFDITPYFCVLLNIFYFNEYFDSMNKLKMFKGKKFHFIGIGGISMSALAQMLKRDGFFVQGSDEVINAEVKRLTKKKIRAFIGHSKDNVLGVDIVVYNSAISEDNPELVFARKKKLIILKRAELLGLIAESYKNVIAVSGSHGKTTATAMISDMFLDVGFKPTIHLGGKLRSINSNYHIGNKKYFITENCEYKDSFLFVKPDISVILNIDSYHLDYFKDLNGVKSSFYKYASGTKEGGLNVICQDDENSCELRKISHTATFGFSNKSDIYAANIREYRAGFYAFDVMFEKCRLGRVKLSIIGKHNILNALACVFVGFVCGIDFKEIKNSLEKFGGVERRCEKLGEINGVGVYHDYAHHPAQIKKMIETAMRLKAPEGRVLTVFEPHTFSRTKFLIDEFAKSFSGSDYLFLAPVYSARETKEDGLTSIDLMSVAKKEVANTYYVKTYLNLVNHIKRLAKKGDIILVLGAGTIEKLAKMIIE